MMPGMLTVDDLRAEVEAEIDTVLLAMADMQGRLQGGRGRRRFLDDVLHHNAEGCNYLLAVDVDMNTVSGYAMSSWDLGYGDFVFQARPVHPADGPLAGRHRPGHGRPRVGGRQPGPGPRPGVLRRQLERLAERGLVAYAGTELEFIVFRDSYEDAWAKAYRDLRHANDYNVDYSLLGTARIEPLLQRIRNSMAEAGLRVESAKGECNYGQHEIAFRYADALATADRHVIYKNGAKEIAAQDGCSLTFMAKYNEREANSCHIHFSVRSADGDGAVMAGDRQHGYSELMEQFVAGQLACLRELTLFLAPNINSYKRFAAGSFAPTAVAWGHDNRTCALRVVGRPVAAAREPRPRRRRQPLPRPGRDHRRRPPRDRQGPGPGGRVHRQRLCGRQAVGPEDATGGPRPVRRQRGRPPGVRRRRGRPLHQHGHRRAGRVRRRRHRLGAVRGFERLSLFEVGDPATEAVIERLEAATEGDADAAVARARAAFEGWRAVAPADRARLLRRLAERLDAERERLAQLEMRNTGKPIGDAGARWAWSSTPSPTTPARPSGCWATPSRWPAGST